MHSSFGNSLHKQYCRRRQSIGFMKDVYEKNASKKYCHPLVHGQISQYWQSHNRYLCTSFTKPQSKNSDEVISVTLGLLIDQKLLQ